MSNCWDLVVLSSRKKFAVECKAWKHGPSIEKPKIAIMREWQAGAGVPIYVAWKAPRKTRYSNPSSVRQ